MPLFLDGKGGWGEVVQTSCLQRETDGEIGKSSYFRGWWLGESHIISKNLQNFDFSAYKLKINPPPWFFQL